VTELSGTPQPGLCLSSSDASAPGPRLRTAEVALGKVEQVLQR
jgi:hypothetical protein